MSEILSTSAQASVNFALACLEPVGNHLRAKSSFVNPQAEIMHWHEFGDLEGPGWAANAIGGAHLLYRWSATTRDAAVQHKALQLVDHILEDGFVQSDGFIWPYFDLAKGDFCLNYAHNNDWFCPGSLAKIGVQLLELAAESTLKDKELATHCTQAASNLAAWLAVHVPCLPSGWLPRRISRNGQAYPLNPNSDADIIYNHSADGLYLLQLWALTGHADLARRAGDSFVAAGGYWGSINHDTFDDYENVAYAVAFRVLRQLADLLDRPAWRDFSYRVALPAMQRFRMDDDRNGVATRGLFWMEESWDTAYLWENAEVAQAHLEAWIETGDERYCQIALGVLEAIARHHYGALGFLTEGVDWNNHVGQQHHVGGVEFGAIRYTEPLLNNLHLVLPTLTYLCSAKLGLRTSDGDRAN